MYYLIAFGIALLTFGLLCLLDKKMKTNMTIVMKIISILLVVLFFVWFMLPGTREISGNTQQFNGNLFRNVFKIDQNNPLEADKIKTLLGIKATTVLGLLGIWFLIMLHTISVLVPWFGNFRIAKHIEKFVSPILVVFDVAVIPVIVYGFSGSMGFSAIGLLIAIEIGLILGKLVFSFAFEFRDFKIYKNEIVEFVLAIFFILMFGMPSFLPKSLIGDLDVPLGGVIGFGQYHRGYIYLLFAYLIGLTLLLRNRKGEYARMALLTIAFLSMITYSLSNSLGFLDIKTPWSWPLHICNTAMFILPIALVTKNEKIFYFTFFVNILGALLAAFMPSYSATQNVISERCLSFWSNHIEACAMPFVCVLTGVFNRPSKKQFFYSMVGFLCYFILVLVLNTILTAYRPTYALSHNGHMYDIPDFFYINSDFVASKFNLENLLYDFEIHFTLFDMEMTMYPLYQAIYFVGFILMSIGMWYVYFYVFKFQDSVIAINNKYRKIKLDEIALCNKYNQKEVKDCMNELSKDKLIISHFSKRYGDKAPFAVQDINFEAKSGEIIGFLGPNGAGKSTTIKAIVGIHLPTEGTIEVNGYDVVSQPVQAKAQLGFVPDHYALYENLTGREYLNYIADLYEVSKEDRDAFLSEFLESLQMEHAIDNKIQTYSHGMKQKIAIMASIIHNPKLWILDEPLTGLDPVSIFQVKQCLKKHAEKGNIVFFSSHLIDIVEKLCDRIIIIADHEVKDVANVHELLKKGVNLEQYYMDKTGQQTGDK